MPVHVFKDPNTGAVIEVEAPEGVPAEELEAYAMQAMAEQQQQPQQQPRPQDYRGGMAGALATGVDAVNRGALGMVDMVPDAVNAGLRLGGAETQIPNATDLYERYIGAPEQSKLPPGPLRSGIELAGNLAAPGAGMQGFVRDPGRASNLARDFMGFGSSIQNTAAAAVPAVAATGGVLPGAGVATMDALRREPAAANIPMSDRLSVLRGEGSTDGVGYRALPDGRVVRDPAQETAITRGFEPKFVATVASSTPSGRRRMNQMLDLRERGLKVAREEVRSRPLDVVGESLATRVRFLSDVNRRAGGQIDEVAETLKGRPVDPRSAVDELLDALRADDVKFDENTGALDFTGSAFEGLSGPQKIITNILKQMRNASPTGEPIDAYALHKMKRKIDAQVSYGTVQEGLDARAARPFKRFRNAIDGLLDSEFPEYDRVNTEYKRTRDAFDALQDLAGKRIDITGMTAAGPTGVGTLIRRLTSNAASREPLMVALDSIDQTVRWLQEQVPGQGLAPYRPNSQLPSSQKIDLDDDIMGQLVFSNELDRVLGAAAETSLMGDIQRQAAESPGRGVNQMLGDAYTAARAAMKGQTTEKQIKALRALLEDRN
jgi:hypothetical protein